ncbi:L-histidine N(alpha)-methyltransferase [Nocardioides caeni]|uniref:L-histidine N(Alpha)-methyltransferase n=1 Tax=Nocardioides caeni TaxID=574700 RepID=A0A4S8NN72_9ACTN|nr:L-histidine N(alpha)-methyltransferase [Nocardioides caeni]THV18308.1 L-histidine N(alpha)-methyltransferase [Nocardioides caeni]
MSVRISVVHDAERAASTLADDVRRGLGAVPRSLPPKWLYDDRGSALFEQITRLAEYYPFAREHEILRDHAAEIAAVSGASTLIELGSGTSEKTRMLLDAFDATGQLERFSPVDVSESTLREAAAAIAGRHPGVAVEAIVGDFTLHLAHLPRGGRRMVAFLGGTIGNLYVEERSAFLGALADQLEPGDSLLLGTDLVKSADRLIAAYNDPGGVTADFVRNSLRVLNRELDADFDLDSFAYVPFWDATLERMDLRLRAEVPQRVAIPGAGLAIDLAMGEEIRVEISTKFRPELLDRELAHAGLTVASRWTDEAGDFALTLATKAEA